MNSIAVKVLCCHAELFKISLSPVKSLARTLAKWLNRGVYVTNALDRNNLVKVTKYLLHVLVKIFCKLFLIHIYSCLSSVQIIISEGLFSLNLPSPAVTASFAKPCAALSS